MHDDTRPATLIRFGFWQNEQFGRRDDSRVEILSELFVSFWGVWGGLGSGSYYSVPFVMFHLCIKWQKGSVWNIVNFMPWVSMCEAAARIWPLLASTPAAGNVCFWFSSDLTHLRRGQCECGCRNWSFVVWKTNRHNTCCCWCCVVLINLIISISVLSVNFLEMIEWMRKVICDITKGTNTSLTSTSSWLRPLRLPRCLYCGRPRKVSALAGS